MFKKIIVSICVIATLVVCVAGLVGCNLEKGADNVEKNEYVNDFDIILEDNNVDSSVESGMTSFQPKLRLSSGEAVINSDNSVTKSITATIYPEDAENKEIRWSIEWVTEPVQGANINDYFILDAGEDNNDLTCYITCIKSFIGGEAKLVATTVDGGFTATASVLFLGVPHSISATYNGTTISSGGSFNIGSSSTSKIIDINLSSVLGDVAEEYKTLELGKVELRGKLVMNVDNSYADTSSEISIYEYDFDNKRMYVPGKPEEYLDYTNESWHGIYSIDYDDFGTVQILNNTLRVKFKTGPEGLSILNDGSMMDEILNTGDKTFLYFNSYITTEEPYIDITVNVPNTEVSINIKVYPQTGVSAIDLNKSSIVF